MGVETIFLLEAKAKISLLELLISPRIDPILIYVYYKL